MSESNEVMAWVLDADTDRVTAVSEDHIHKMFDVHGQGYLTSYIFFFADLVPAEPETSPVIEPEVEPDPEDSAEE